MDSNPSPKFKIDKNLILIASMSANARKGFQFKLIFYLEAPSKLLNYINQFHLKLNYLQKNMNNESNFSSDSATEILGLVPIIVLKWINSSKNGITLIPYGT